MPTITRIGPVAGLHAGVDTASTIGGPGSSITEGYTLTETVNGSTDYSIADISSIAVLVTHGGAYVGHNANPTTFSIVKLGAGVYSGGNWGVFAIQGYPGLPYTDISWSGKTVTITWHVGDAASLLAGGLPVRDDYEATVLHMTLVLDVVVPDSGGGGGGPDPLPPPEPPPPPPEPPPPLPPPVLVTREITGLSCNWHRDNHPEDVAYYEVGRKAHVTWAWAGWADRPVLMDELRRVVGVEDNPPATRRHDTWRVFTYPGTSVVGGTLFGLWDDPASLWDSALWAA